MLNQSSCIHTPQQNGVAERKNRHLVDIARTLLLHSHTPPQYWADVVLTACHLINRMPSSILNNEIPYSILFPDRDLFPLPPHVFGCVCFVHDTTLGLAKMSARSIKCIFLGYSRLQKGYRCYSPLLKKHFISADVTFIESSFYYPLSSVDTPSCLDLTSYLRPIHLETPIQPPSDGHPNCSPMVDRPVQVYHHDLDLLPLCLLWPRRLIPLRRIPYLRHQLPQHPKILRIICPLPSEKVRVLL
ncbi:unnamed protein product [Cuscuta europaea]|uniref:Retroviral polymerase SH3-like domain-containing protein n=1 Tax=Cuscuta europaea TaxID=41803 RepID=A0A9P1EKC9_CUSEU|nr:unnamed protein product [Cuscuta europaea]